LITEPAIFISHISEEAEVATALKDVIEQHFPGPSKVFVSSDGESIKMGRDWLDKVFSALRTCEAQIVVCSPKSVTSNMTTSLLHSPSPVGSRSSLR
jgi:TIR domain